jgi:hypothetical protein
MHEYIGPHTRPLALCLVVGVAVYNGGCSAPRDAARLAVGESKTVVVATSDVGDIVSGGPRKRGGVPSATNVVLSSNVRVCTNAYHPGDRFTATVTDTAIGADGTAIPAGSLASFHVTEISVNGTRTGAPHIAVVLDSLDIDGVRYPATARTTSVATRRVRSSRSNQRPPKSGIGAMTRDPLGEPLGGAAPLSAPGASRASGVARPKTYAVCIPQRGRITLTTAARPLPIGRQ